MKLHLILLFILAFVAGVYAEKTYYYRIDPMNETTFAVACTDGEQPFTTMRLGAVMEVHCRAPKH